MKFKKYIVMFLLICEFISLFLTFKSFSNKEINEIKETYEVKNKTFSMFIENEEGNYTEYIESNLFPSNYVINLDESKCVDAKGNVIDGILSGNGTNITVKSSTTSYCYLYFDINPLNEILQSENIWESTLEDDGYRYVGTDPDNYICFGTTDKDECKNNTDLYMYRIIGIFEDETGIQHLKLIKKEALNTRYAWHSDSSTDIDWQDSDLYKGINGSYFLTNTTYSYMQNTNWTNKIATWNYTTINTLSYENYSTNRIYGPNYYNNVVKTTYLHEMNRSSKINQTCYYSYSSGDLANVVMADCNVGEWETVSAKIGLMYVSDYQLSLGSTALDYINSNSTHYASMKTGWMHITNNDSESSGYEWTMSRYGANSLGDYFAWAVYSSGLVYNNYVHNAYSVRPVFYLTTDVTIIGDGTIESPYIIEN